MTTDERRAWIVLGSLFATLFFVFPSGNAFGVFLPHLVKQFNCSRAQAASLFSVWTITLGLSAPVVGSLLDRFDARYLMTAGALLCGGAAGSASSAHFFLAMFAAYLLMGLGAGFSCIVPCSIVTARWFSANRGVAMGLVFSGMSIGAGVMTLVITYVAVRAGWNAAYLALALPMLIVVAPLLFVNVRTRPAASGVGNPAQTSESASTGLTLSAAARTRSFWLIIAAYFSYTFVVTGMVVHLFAYLLGKGYRQQPAALAMSLVHAFATFGKPLMGAMADRLSARRTLALCFGAEALTLLLLFAAQHVAVLVVFVPLFGFIFASPLALLSLLIAESLGLRNYGSLSGVIGLTSPIGTVLGPIAAGWIFDLTKSYAPALELFAAVQVLGAIASYACVPLGAQDARLRPAGTAAASET